MDKKTKSPNIHVTITQISAVEHCCLIQILMSKDLELMGRRLLFTEAFSQLEIILIKNMLQSPRRFLSFFANLVNVIATQTSTGTAL